MTPPPIEFAFLEDGAQSAEGTASILAQFLAAATSTLEIAIYDLRLSGMAAATLLDAVQAAKARGVAIRIVFNHEHPKPRPIPAPSDVDWDLLRQMGVPFQPVSGIHTSKRMSESDVGCSVPATRQKAGSAEKSIGGPPPPPPGPGSLKPPAGTSTAVVIVAFFNCKPAASAEQEAAAFAEVATTQAAPMSSSADIAIRAMSSPSKY